MNQQTFKTLWKKEEESAFQGWDFSHIHGRHEDEPLPWDYREIMMTLLKPEYRLLDMGTGGGEFLLSLGHPHHLTTVTEAYAPNLALCREKLAPLGITVVATEEDNRLELEDASMDLVINRHESFDPVEVARVLKPGGYFITQQVGGENNFDLSRRLIPGYNPPFWEHTLKNNTAAVEKAGMTILQAGEAFPAIRFFDVGALVYFAKIIEWEFPGFSVESAFEALLDCQRDVERQGFVQGREHRFYIVAKKK